MWLVKVTTLCLLCTGLTFSIDLKGDPELDGPLLDQLLSNEVDLEFDLEWKQHQHDRDLGPDPLDELDNHVQKMVKHLDAGNEKGDKDIFEDEKYSRHNHYVNYPLAMHPHHRQKRFFKGIVKGIKGAVKGVGGFLKGGLGGILNIAGTIFGRPQATSAASHYHQSMRFSLQQLCNEICVTEWTMWEPCSKPCGGGQQSRTRTRQLPGQCKTLKDFTCPKSTSQTRSCNEGCANGGRPNEQGCQCLPGWSGQCCHTRPVCEYPGKPRNGRLSGTFPAYYRAVAQFECHPGFSLQGDDDVMHCQADGTWRGQKPECGAISCSAQAPNEHVRVLNPASTYTFGEEVIYRCTEGYVLDGPQARRCQSPSGAAQGRLTGFNPICRAVTCEDPGVPAHAQRVITDLKFGGIANFTCENGYKLVGNPSMRCLASGNWLGRLPTCEEIKCDPPFPPRFGGVQLRSARFGASVVFHCDDGYELIGNASLRCQDDGYWDGVEPKCKAINCGNPGVPDHGSKDGSQYTFPHTVKYACYNGYRLEGVEEIECQKDATWSNTKPSCRACPLNTYMDELRNPGTCLPCGAHMHTNSEGSTHKLNCLCDEGYTGPAGGPCIKIECTPLSPPVHGSISSCTWDLGSTCSFTCSQGYVLDKGTPVRTCQNNGQWDGSEAVCSACPENTYKSDERSCLPCPDNSFTNDTTANDIQGCVCREGYSGPAGGPCTDVNECVENGGRGACEQACENRDGGYLCGCNIPGYILDVDQHTCKANKTCSNLTRDDAPSNGGLVCHWYREENSQQCGVRCNKGYEFPSRINDYEYCGAATGYLWSFRRDDPEAEIPPCIEQFYPDYILEASTSYFVRACDELTPEEQLEVKQHFIGVLNENKICEKRETKVCDVGSVGIVCGRRTLRRRKRGVEEELSSVDFSFKIQAFKEDETVLSCPDICEKFKIPDRHCENLCWNVYKRFLRASVAYAQRELKVMYQDRDKLARMRFRAARREFEPEENSAQSEGVEQRCPPGMVYKNETEICVPCFAGSYFDEETNECRFCPEGMYQMLRNQTHCDHCPNGTSSIMSNKETGPTFCLPCIDGRYGQYCEGVCDCTHGICDPNNGTCICESGWEGDKCDEDIQGCAEGTCFEGVQCLDVPAPGTGFTCGPCPQGFHGDGASCTPIGGGRGRGGPRDAAGIRNANAFAVLNS